MIEGYHSGEFGQFRLAERACCASLRLRRWPRAPPPFIEKLATYRVRVANGVVEVDPRPLPPGTPAAISFETSAAGG
jgi:hypothetical protein